jgi:hypothetical protein
MRLRRSINWGGALFFALLIPVYFGWTARDISQWRSFCGNVHGGVSRTEPPEIAKRHWIAPHWV